MNGALPRLAVASVPLERAAMGSGANNTARYVGASIGVTIVSIVAAAPGGTRGHLVAGWNAAAVGAAVASLAGAAVVLTLARLSWASGRRRRG